MKLNNDFVEGNIKNDIEVKQFKTRKDLDILSKTAGDRPRWKEVFAVMHEANSACICRHCKPDVLYHYYYTVINLLASLT